MTTLAAAYLRCSTDQQDTSIEQQEDAIVRYCCARGYRIIAKYADEGVSGTKLERPGLSRAVREAKDPETEWKILVCYDRTRWGRFDDPRAPVWLEYELALAGRGLEFVRKAYPEGVVGVIMKTLDDYMAQQDREAILTRLQRGRAHAVQNGLWVGGRPPYGYDLNTVRVGTKTRTVLVVNEGEAAVVRRIYAMHEQGLSLRGIANVLTLDDVPTPKRGKKWSGEAVRIILSNPVYRGRLEFAGKRWGIDYKVAGDCPAIIGDRTNGHHAQTEGAAEAAYKAASKTQGYGI